MGAINHVPKIMGALFVNSCSTLRKNHSPGELLEVRLTGNVSSEGEPLLQTATAPGGRSRMYE